MAYDLGFAPTGETAVFAAGADALEPEFWKVIGKDFAKDYDGVVVIAEAIKAAKSS